MQNNMDLMLYNVNLLDWRASRKRRAMRQCYWLGLGVLFVGAAGVLMAIRPLYFGQLRDLTRLHLVQSSIELLTRKHTALLQLNQAASQASMEAQQLEQWQFLKQAPVALMSQLYQIIPADMYLETVEQHYARVAISGIALNPEAFDRFVAQLEKTAFLGQLDIRQLTVMKHLVGGQRAYRFQITGQLISSAPVFQWQTIH